MEQDTKTITAAAAAKIGSYYKLAKALGVRQSAVSAWKNGKNNANGPHLLAMLKIAGKLALMAAISLSFSIPYDSKAQTVQNQSDLYIMRSMWGILDSFARKIAGMLRSCFITRMLQSGGSSACHA